MAGTTRRGARPAHGHRSRDPRGGLADDGWPVLVAGLGRQCKLKRASGWVPGKVIDGGAHLSGVPAARGRARVGGCARRRRTSRWWPAVTPVRSYGYGEGMWSLGLSQFRREHADAKLTEEGNDGGASAQIR
jgi:hypothetical protein